MDGWMGEWMNGRKHALMEEWRSENKWMVTVNIASNAADVQSRCSSTTLRTQLIKCNNSKERLKV